MESLRRSLTLFGLSLDNEEVAEHGNDSPIPGPGRFDSPIEDHNDTPSARNRDAAPITKPKKCAFFYLDGIKYTIGK